MHCVSILPIIKLHVVFDAFVVEQCENIDCRTVFKNAVGQVKVHVNFVQ